MDRRRLWLGLNGLYLNLKGREPGGIIEPENSDALLNQLAAGLEAVVDGNGEVIAASPGRPYLLGATALAPTSSSAGARGYRVSWATVQGDLPTKSSITTRPGARPCADALRSQGSCSAIARFAPPTEPRRRCPSILAEFGLSTPSSMVGRNIFSG